MSEQTGPDPPGKVISTEADSNADQQPVGNAFERAFGFTSGDQLVLCVLGGLMLIVISFQIWRIKGGSIRPIVIDRSPTRTMPETVPATPRFRSADDAASVVQDPITKLVPEPARPLYTVNVNHSEWFEWAELPGIGEVLARRIIEARKQQGGFRTLQDVRDVKGIGRKTWPKIEPHLVITPDR